MSDRTVSVKLQANVGDYLAKFSAAGKATSDLGSKVTKASGETRRGMDTIGRGLVLGGGAIVAGFAIAEKKFMDFSAQMAQVGTLSHATAADMGLLRDAALHMGNGIGFSATEVADAETELVKAGVSVSDILGGALNGALTLAAAGQVNVADATETAAIAMTQFKLAGKDVPHIADLLAAGADKALGSVGDLSYALQSGGLVAAQFGLSIEDTVGTLAAFAQAGLMGERAGTTLRQMLLQLTAPSKQAGDLMTKLGLHTYDASGQFVGITKLAGQLHNKLGTLTQAERDHALAVIFGAHAIQGANVLLTEGAKGIQGWINNVDDSGFAALQAAGKMDSLKGDLSKLTAEFNTAFIETGSESQGFARGAIQDITSVIHVYNELPGPAKTAATAIVAVGGAVTLASGAMLIAVPRVQALNAAMLEASGGAIGARRAFTALGKGGLIAAAVIGVAEGLQALEKAMDHPPDVDKLTTSLERLTLTGKASGELVKTFGPNLEQFGGELRHLGDKSTADGIAHVAQSIGRLGGLLGSTDDLPVKRAKEDFDALDKSLSGLVTGGHADVADDVFRKLAAAARAQGVPLKLLTSALPQYGRALDQSATSAKLAANGVDQFGNKVASAASASEKATTAAKDYNDALHSLADPLFAMNKALSDLRDKQQAAAEATHKHGKASREARQANIDLASSALDVEAAATTLAGSVAAGTTSLAAAKQQLHQWARAGLLTKDQANDVASSFDNILTRADKLAGKRINVVVNADTETAINNVSRLKAWLDLIHDKTVQVTVRNNAVTTGPGRAVQQPNLASGGPISGPGSGTSDSIPAMLSNGEFVVRADGSNLPDAMRFYGAPGFAFGGTVGGVTSGVMSGNLPQSVDKLSAVMRAGLSKLSNVVQAAKEYRSSVASNLQGYAGLAGAAGSGVSAVTFRRAKLNDLRRFSKLYHRLEARHLNKADLADLMQAGPAAIPVMQDLLRPGQVHAENVVARQTSRLTGNLAGAATRDQYGPKLAAAINGLPGPIGREVGKAVARELRHMHIQVNVNDGGHAVVRHRRAG